MTTEFRVHDSVETILIRSAMEKPALAVPKPNYTELLRVLTADTITSNDLPHDISKTKGSITRDLISFDRLSSLLFASR